MSGREHFEDSHISDNISTLLATKLEIGNYGFEEGGKNVYVEISNFENGQYWKIDTNDALGSLSIGIEIKPRYSDDPMPEIIATSTRKISGEKVVKMAFWHSNMSRELINKFTDVMNEADLIRAIEYAKSPKKSPLPKKNK